MRLKKKNGFTFIELLVAITIIAILSGIAMVNFQVTNRKSRDTRRRSDMEQIRSALELCRSDNGSYPASLGTSVVCGTTTYLNPVPTDPKGGTDYEYTRTSTTTYSLCTNLMENEDNPYCVNNP